MAHRSLGICPQPFPQLLIWPLHFTELMNYKDTCAVIIPDLPTLLFCTKGIPDFFLWLITFRYKNSVCEIIMQRCLPLSSSLLLFALTSYLPASHNTSS